MTAVPPAALSSAMPIDATSFRLPLQTPNKLLASLNMTLAPSRHGFPPFAAGTPYSYAAARSEHVFTPGLLFSTAGKAASRSGGNDWWSTAATSAENGPAGLRLSASTARALEINPFEMALASSSDNLQPAQASLPPVPQNAPLAPVTSSAHARRATVSFGGSGLTPFLTEYGASLPTSDLWSSLNNLPPLESTYGGMEGWIDFSAGHSGTPGALNSVQLGRSTSVKRAASVTPAAEVQSATKRPRMALPSVVHPAALQVQRDLEQGPTVLERMKTKESFASERSPESLLDPLGPSPLASGLTTGSADTTLTPPLSLDLLSANMIATGPSSGGIGMTIHQRRQDNPYSKKRGSGVAPDLTQAVPTFVGIERYSNTVAAAPEGARDVVAEFLRTMRGGAATVPDAPAPASNVKATTNLDPKVATSTPIVAPVTSQLTAAMDWPSQRDPILKTSKPQQSRSKVKSLPVSVIESQLKSGEWILRDSPKPNANSSIVIPKDKVNDGSLPSPSHSDFDASANEAKSHATEEDKRKLFLERNRVAACKSRAKKKEWQEALEQRASELTAQNAELQTLVSVMRDEIVSLRGMVASHAACSCGSLKGFVEAGGLGVPQGFGVLGLGRPATIGAAAEYVRNQHEGRDGSTMTNRIVPPTKGPVSTCAPLFIGRRGSVGASGAMPSSIPIGTFKQPDTDGLGSALNFSATSSEFERTVKLPIRPNSAPPTTPTPGLMKTDMSSYFVGKG